MATDTQDLLLNVHQLLNNRHYVLGKFVVENYESNGLVLRQ